MRQIAPCSSIWGTLMSPHLYCTGGCCSASWPLRRRAGIVARSPGHLWDVHAALHAQHSKENIGVDEAYVQRSRYPEYMFGHHGPIINLSIHPSLYHYPGQTNNHAWILLGRHLSTHLSIYVSVYLYNYQINYTYLSLSTHTHWWMITCTHEGLGEHVTRNNVTKGY